MKTWKPALCRECGKKTSEHTLKDKCMIVKLMKELMIRNGYTEDLEDLV
jgi:hypothetical protein